MGPAIMHDATLKSVCVGTVYTAEGWIPTCLLPITTPIVNFGAKAYATSQAVAAYQNAQTGLYCMGVGTVGGAAVSAVGSFAIYKACQLYQKRQACATEVKNLLQKIHERYNCDYRRFDRFNDE